MKFRSRLATVPAAAALSLAAGAALAGMPAPSADPAAWASARAPSQANFPGGAENYLFFPSKTSPVLPNDPVAGARLQAAAWPFPLIDYSWSFPAPGAGTMHWVYQLGGPTRSGILPLGPNFGYRLPAMPDGTQVPLDASDFAADCGGPVFGYEYKWIGGTQLVKTGQHVCTITKAPVLDAGTLMRALEAANWSYMVAFPMADHGNGRGLLFWSSNPGTGVISPIYQGFARVYNVKWQNQFAPRDVPVCNETSNWCVPYAGTTNFPYSDAIGGYIASLPSPARDSGLRGFQHAGGDWATGASLPYAVIVADDWVAEPLTPPAPPPVPLQPAPPPPSSPPSSPTNLPGQSTAGGSGAPGAATGDVDGGAFDWEAYCRMPNPDGTPKPNAWIENCLATGH